VGPWDAWQVLDAEDVARDPPTEGEHFPISNSILQSLLLVKTVRMVVSFASNGLPFNHVSESSPHFSLSKWCLQEESNSSDVVSAQDSAKPKLRHRGSAATLGISTCIISTF
jgi:hypothetical protein